MVVKIIAVIVTVGVRVILVVEVVIIVSSGIIIITSGSTNRRRIIGKNVISKAIWNAIRRMMKRDK